MHEGCEVSAVQEVEVSGGGRGTQDQEPQLQAHQVSEISCIGAICVGLCLQSRSSLLL